MTAIADIDVDVRTARRELRRHFLGHLHLPGEDGYDEGRAALDPQLDARPLLVAEADSAQDVRAALNWARGRRVPFAVQSTGHGTHVASGGGLLLKTSALRRVLVDPDRGIARVGAGARWGDVLAAAAPFGLAPLSGSSPDVGVAGYTLGGGLSWLSRRFGFAADSVLRAEVVTADGRTVTASHDEHPELFWALRGGGGNFGVVTSLEFRLHRVPRVWSGSAAFPISRAAGTLAAYRDWIAAAPDDVSTAIVLVPSWPGTDQPALVLRAMSSGDAGTAVRALRPLFEAAGTPLWEDFREARFADTRMPGVAPRDFDLAASLPDAVIERLVDAVPSVSAIEVRHWGGAMARPGGDAGPVGHRDVPLSIIIDGPSEVADSVRLYMTGGTFLNFLHDPSRVEAAFTPDNYRWLREGRLDPDNVLSVNHNIPAPADRPRRVYL